MGSNMEVVSVDYLKPHSGSGTVVPASPLTLVWPLASSSVQPTSSQLQPGAGPCGEAPECRLCIFVIRIMYAEKSASILHSS
jgi:hypothetical protein